MDDDRIDKGGEKNTVYKIGTDMCTFCNGPTNNTTCGADKHPLEKKKFVSTKILLIIIVKKETLVSNKRVTSTE
jgi:hypothetical protein